MKKFFKFRALTAIALILVCTISVVAQRTTPVPTITIGAQSGALRAGTAGTVSFTLTTNVLTRVRSGSVEWYTEPNGQNPGGRPLGVTTNLSMSTGGANSVEVKTTTNTLAGAYYFRVIIDNITSGNVGILRIDPITAGRDVQAVAPGVSREISIKDLHVTEDPVTQDPVNVYYPQSAVINGVTWATCNVGLPGTFTENPGYSFAYYQFNSNRAWLPDSPNTEMVMNHPGGLTWEAANDPCPDGWRVPTKAEFESLFDVTKVRLLWSTYSGFANQVLNGLWVYDLANPNYPIFLPAVGRIYATDNHPLYEYNALGHYWSGTIQHTDGDDMGYHLCIYSSMFQLEDVMSNSVGLSIFSTGFPVRCVKK